jgi:Fe-S-cluster containining protein
VWVNKSEIEALAAKVEMTIADFEKQYVRQVGARKSLVEYPNGDCVFFDGIDRKCTVYEARPRQCRTWPFWDSNLKTPQAWERTCEVCPGSGKGPLVSVEEIVKQVAVIRL